MTLFTQVVSKINKTSFAASLKAHLWIYLGSPLVSYLQSARSAEEARLGRTVTEEEWISGELRAGTIRRRKVNPNAAE